MDKGRIMALTDGIVAIAATIMVLELSIPDQLTVATLMAEWPTFAAYLVSFWLIYLAWRSHHNAFQKADVLSTQTYLVNGVWLFLVSLVPFGTGLIGRYPESRVAAVVYVGIVFFWTLTFQFLDASIIKSNPDAPKDEVMYPFARTVMFGGFALAFAAIMARPIFAVMVLAVSNGIMGIWLILRRKMDPQKYGGASKKADGKNDTK